ncbi:MAG: FGGY family carbohydrate kinase [Actinobacteria bacterium]|nr:FGGY family carbohydrate kinase [Actinomycetota bacterium]
MSLLGIDIGSTGTKAIVFNADGEILTSDYREYNLLFPQPGWVEFDTNDQWSKIFNVLKKVNSEPSVKKDPVTALSVSTFGEGLTPVNENGNIIFNTIYSIDARSIKELEFILSKYGRKELFEVTGFPPGFICPLNKILWIKNNRAEIYKKTKKILFTDDLFYHKLGIEDLKINYSLASRTLFFNVRKKIWANDILSGLDIDVNLFSKPSPSGIEIGYIKKSIAEELGFSGNVSVITGCHDQPCAAFGVGAIEGGIAADGMGTVECATICMEEALTNENMLEYNYSLQAHAIKNKYVTLAYNLSSGSIIKWFRDNLSDGQNNTIRKISSRLTYEPSRLFTLPYFSASGTPFLDPIAKGSIIGLDLDTTKEDIFKGLIEGLVFEICNNLELTKKSGIKLTELRASGGGAKSDYELLLKASLLDRPILRMDITEAGCLGAMILAGTGKGKFTLDEAVLKFIKIKDRFEPDKNIREKYIDKFEKYKEIYGLVSQLYN